jgi:hypothetical protein
MVALETALHVADSAVLLRETFFHCGASNHPTLAGPQR